MKSLDIKNLHDEFDKRGMLELAEALGSHFGDARRIAHEFASKVKRLETSDVSRIVVCGMGGSAIGADLVRTWAEDSLKTPLYVSRNYKVPGSLSKEALVVFSSYSGNTRETLSSYGHLRSSGNPKLAITSGGTLAEYCERDNLPMCLIPGGMPPRAAIAYSFVPLLMSLSAAGLLALDEEEMIEAESMVLSLCRQYSLEAGGGDALALARKLQGRLPFVYAYEGLLAAVSRRWACQFNENSKTLAHFALFPELCHNEIVGWELLEDVLSNIAIVVLEDEEDDQTSGKQMENTLELIAPHGPEILRLKSKGGSRLARMLSLLVLGDFTSVYLALLNHVDPTPVEKIDILKKRMV